METGSHSGHIKVETDSLKGAVVKIVGRQTLDEIPS